MAIVKTEVRRTEAEATGGSAVLGRGGAPTEIQIRHIVNCLKANSAHGKGVADALGDYIERATPPQPLFNKT
jgi:hypothetical protein